MNNDHIGARAFAGQIGCSVITARRILDSGAVPGAYRLFGGGRSHWRIPPNAIKQFLRNRAAQTAQPKEVQ